MEDLQIDIDLMDECVLGLMFLTLHDDGRSQFSLSRAWKSFDWDALSRLHAKGLILDPVNKAKSVTLTEEGRRRCKAAFYRQFAREKGG